MVHLKQPSRRMLHWQKFNEPNLIFARKLDENRFELSVTLINLISWLAGRHYSNLSSETDVPLFNFKLVEWMQNSMQWILMQSVQISSCCQYGGFERIDLYTLYRISIRYDLLQDIINDAEEKKHETSFFAAEPIFFVLSTSTSFGWCHFRFGTRWVFINFVMFWHSHGICFDASPHSIMTSSNIQWCGIKPTTKPIGNIFEAKFLIEIIFMCRRFFFIFHAAYAHFPV